MSARAVVIGAGVLGSFHALAALRRGWEVVHLEREQDARGASVRNFGLVWVSGRRPGPELALALRARSLWEELGREVPELGFRPNGSLTLVQDEAELRVLEQVVERPDAAERRLELLDAAQVTEVNPTVRGRVLAGLLCRADAAVEPQRVPGAVRAVLEREPGYRWLPGRHVVELDDGWARDHRGERHAGDVVIVCPGAAHGCAGWQPENAPLRRVRLQMLETEPFGHLLTTSIADGDSLRYYPAFDVPARAYLARQPPLVAELGIQLLLQQRLDGRLTVGDTHEFEEPFAVSVAEAPYRHLRERVESLLGEPMPPVRRRWAGIYSQATDERLYYRERLGKSTWVVTGAGGRGMTLAPAIAEEVIGLVLAGYEPRVATASSTGR
ncbi:MAG TPA: TIGR03364 family FAD-dependent oxidoreductase [Gaiellaceae bacterium]|nr:TIGR03364 family FAD-dependent oxidoreductase [Gaiellaceae bacterium]